MRSCPPRRRISSRSRLHLRYRQRLRHLLQLSWQRSPHGRPAHGRPAHGLAQLSRQVLLLETGPGSVGDCTKALGDCTKTHREPQNRCRGPQRSTQQRPRTAKKSPGTARKLPGTAHLFNCQDLHASGRKLQKKAGDLSPAKRLLFYSFVSSIAEHSSNQGHSRQAPSRTIPSRAMCMVLHPE